MPTPAPVTNNSRRLRIAAVTLLVLATGCATSFWRARHVADLYIGQVPGGYQRTHHGLIPFRRYPPTHHWGWAIAYDDAHDDGFEVYVSLSGGALGTNPPGLRDRLPVAKTPAPFSTAPPPM